jgi:uncharacterized protein YdcH (DUF465 family)
VTPDRKATNWEWTYESRECRRADAPGKLAQSSANHLIPLHFWSNSLVGSRSGRFTPPLSQEIHPMDLHHPILREFPEHREVIRRLKGANEHFRQMFEEYHRLDDSIYRIEEEIDFATDQEIEELKLRRAKLKDYIYHLIRHAPPVCPTCEGTGIAP